MCSLLSLLHRINSFNFLYLSARRDSNPWIDDSQSSVLDLFTTNWNESIMGDIMPSFQIVIYRSKLLILLYHKNFHLSTVFKFFFKSFLAPVARFELAVVLHTMCFTDGLSQWDLNPFLPELSSCFYRWIGYHIYINYERIIFCWIRIRTLLPPNLQWLGAHPDVLLNKFLLLS